MSRLTHSDDFVLTGSTKKLMEFEEDDECVCHQSVGHRLRVVEEHRNVEQEVPLGETRNRVSTRSSHVDVLVKDFGLEQQLRTDTSNTRRDRRGRVRTTESGSASQIQVTSCQMFVPQSRSSKHNLHCERAVPKDVESQSTEPCQAKKACQVFKNARDSRDKCLDMEYWPRS